MELGVIIRYCMEIYNPDFKEYKTAKVSTFASLYFMPIKKKFTDCVGHKRIIPLESLNASNTKDFTFKITETAGDAKIRDAAIY